MTLSEIGSVVLVGAGKMGMAMAHGWLAAGLRSSNLVLVSPRPKDNLVDFAGEKGIRLERSLTEKNPAILVLGVKPQVMPDIFPDVKASAGPETIIVSIAAGITMDRLIEGCGTNKVVRTMPNTPAQVGKGVTGAVAGPGITETDKEIVSQLLQASGKAVWFEQEEDLNAMTGISGCGPAYVFLLVESMAAAGVNEGLDPDQAMTLARQTVIGAAGLMEEDPTDAQTLRKNVTSPKGVTAEALAVLMEEGGLPDLMKRAVSAARKRNAELGK